MGFGPHKMLSVLIFGWKPWASSSSDLQRMAIEVDTE